LCAKQGTRYQIAQDHCHTTAPLGWVRERDIEPLYTGQFPEALITPMPEE
jgi:hypothetical protein